MLTVSPLATEKLTGYLQENCIISSLRVFLAQGGCGGPSLALALDDKKENDETFEAANLTILVEKTLLEQCGNITVDYIDAGSSSGFSVRSSNSLPGAGGCSSGSCSGGCGSV